MASYRVEATSLHLRSQPIISPASKIALLSHGQIVEKLDASPTSVWWRISANINGVDVTGYINSTFVKPVGEFSEPTASRTVSPVHLSTNTPISRSGTNGRAFPLNEPGQPRRLSGTPEGKTSELHAIVNWLKVDESQRYLPKPGETYCNIYACDFCYLANVYLPRVWWTSKAIAMIATGEAVSPIYDKTVLEVNANSLHNWFSEYGDDFGWRRTFALNDLQKSANAGAVCIISARRKELNRPGHICAVVPETATHKSIIKNGEVTTPVQSNAGASNFRYGGRVWWTSDKFSSFSFWIHD